MKATIDLPDDLLKEAAVAAKQRGVSLENLISEALAKEVTASSVRNLSYRVKSPLIPARGSETISVTNEQIEELLFE